MVNDFCSDLSNLLTIYLIIIKFNFKLSDSEIVINWTVNESHAFAKWIEKNYFSKLIDKWSKLRVGKKIELIEDKVGKEF